MNRAYTCNYTIHRTPTKSTPKASHHNKQQQQRDLALQNKHLLIVLGFWIKHATVSSLIRQENLYNIRCVESFLLGLPKMANFVAVLMSPNDFATHDNIIPATIHISAIVKIPTAISSNEDHSRCWNPCAQGGS